MLRHCRPDQSGGLGLGQRRCLWVSKPAEKRGLQVRKCKPPVLKPSMWMQAVVDADAGDQGRSTAAHHTAAGTPNATAEVRYISNRSTIPLALAAAPSWRLMCPHGTQAASKPAEGIAWPMRRLTCIPRHHPVPQNVQALSGICHRLCMHSVYSGAHALEGSFCSAHWQRG